MDATARSIALRYLAQLLSGSDLESAQDSVNKTKITVPETVFVPSPFKCTELITGINTAVVALCQLISQDRIGKTQEAEIDCVHATASLTPHYSYSIDGMSSPESLGFLATTLGYLDPLRLWRAITNHTYKCRDDKYIVFYTRPADNPAKLLDAIGFSSAEISRLVPLLETPEGRLEYYQSVASKIESWNSDELEANVIKKNATATIVGQTEQDFKNSEHGKLAQTWPVIDIKMTKGWKPVAWARMRTPTVFGILHGVKVLEMSRVLLGPRAGCLLAALGAEIVRVNSPLIDEGPVVDVQLGKRSLHLDMKKPGDKVKFEELLKDCDVFLSNNALGVMDRRGFGFQDVCKLIANRDRGVVYAEANAFGFDGPYASAGGYEHLSHFISGLGMTQGAYHHYTDGPQPNKPAAIPINVLDVSTGHSLALGVIEGLRRRARDGGSHLVQTSLLQVGLMLQSAGIHPREVVDQAWKHYVPEPSTVDPERPFGGGAFGYFAAWQCMHFRNGYPQAFAPSNMITIKDAPWLPSGHTMSIVKPALSLSETPVGYRLSTRPFGYDKVAKFLGVENTRDLVKDGDGWRFVGKQEGSAEARL